MARYGAKVSSVDTGIYWSHEWVPGSLPATAKIRREAIHVTKGGGDAAAEFAVSEIIIWPGQSGFEYPFQADHVQA